MRPYFDECPEVDYSYRDELPTVIVAADGPYYTDRYSMAHLAARMYAWVLRRTDEERGVIDAFMQGVGFMRDAFYIKDPKDAERTGVDLGTAGAGQTVYTLPTLGEPARGYPLGGSVTLYLDGAPVSVDSVDTDARTITATTPATGGESVTADYTELRLVRLSAPYDWNGVDAKWYTTSMALTEVVGD